MHPIRTAIICCSIMLTAWLAASYTTQLEPSRKRAGGIDTDGKITVLQQADVTSATSIDKRSAGSDEGEANKRNDESSAAPIAQVK